jgi:hypothetical protein
MLLLPFISESVREPGIGEKQFLVFGEKKRSWERTEELRFRSRKQKMFSNLLLVATTKAKISSRSDGFQRHQK